MIGGVFKPPGGNEAVLNVHPIDVDASFRGEVLEQREDLAPARPSREGHPRGWIVVVKQLTLHVERGRRIAGHSPTDGGKLVVSEAGQ